MKIERFSTDTAGGQKRISATVTWEDCEQPPCEIYFETDSRFAESLWCNPDAFLVGCVIPAFAQGESRILVEEPICPELREGLMTALMWLRHWYYSPDRKLPTIEAKVRASASQRTTAARAGLLFSGGVDSLATLRWNRLRIPREHPASIKDGVLIFGLQGEDAQMRREIETQLSVIAEDAKVTLVPIATNLVKNLRGMAPWEDQWEAGALAAVAHTLAGRLTHLGVGPTHDISTMMPLGSHPVLDPNYSSRDLRIRHEGIILSRFAKTKLVSEWDTALQNLRVCNKIPFGKRTEQGTLNCGQCEKCVRTMLGLVALGALDRTRAFPSKQVSADLVRSIPGFDRMIRYRFYIDLIGPLKEKGREDLVREIEDLMKRGRPRQVAKLLEKKLVEVDQHYLNGWLGKVKRLACSVTHPGTVKSNGPIDLAPTPLASYSDKTK